VATVPDEDKQHFESLRRERDGRAVAQQEMFGGVQTKRAELVNVLRITALHGLRKSFGKLLEFFQDLAALFDYCRQRGEPVLRAASFEKFDAGRILMRRSSQINSLSTGAPEQRDGKDQKNHREY
jgi:hypothetical protein